LVDPATEPARQGTHNTIRSQDLTNQSQANLGKSLGLGTIYLENIKAKELNITANAETVSSSA
jgi:hypothetical protein